MLLPVKVSELARMTSVSQHYHIIVGFTAEPSKWLPSGRDIGWQLGVLVCTEDYSSRALLESNPMQLIRVIESSGTDVKEPSRPPYCISICRQASLGTFRFSNEYSSVQNVGDNIGSVDASLLRFPTVITLSARDVFSHDLPDLLDLQVDPVHFGLQRPHAPDVLLTTPAVTSSLQCFNRESVWYRTSTLPVPLERVVLAMSCDLSGHDHEEARNVVSRIYQLSKEGPLILHQDFDFTVGFEDGFPIRVNVLETFPTLQGSVSTSKTTIAILPTDGLPPPLDDPDSLESRPRAESASNFDLEGPLATGDYVIEAITMSDFPLQNHFVVLPKESARRYNIQHCQNIWVSPSLPLRRNLSKRKSVIQLDGGSGVGGGGERGKERTHMAIALLYEDTQQLEKYLPPREFGRRYLSAPLSLAYVHPELLYYLYPETISPSRTFKITIKVHCRYIVIYYQLIFSYFFAACERRYVHIIRELLKLILI